MNLAEIRELKEYYTKDLYNDLRGEQRIDLSYINDTFGVPEVKQPHEVFHEGLAYKIVSSAAEQMVTSNPQAFLYTDKKTQQESAKKLSREINEKWVTGFKRQVPNLFKELVKNKIGLGESYIKLVHNESWVTGKQQKTGTPVMFIPLDPIVVYASPQDDNSGWHPRIGVPNQVVVSYPRQPNDVMRKYPSWSNPRLRDITGVSRSGGTKGDHARELVDWWEYWDKDIRYFEADGEPVLKGGIQPNDYGFTPFVHKYSGFGKESPDGDLSSLAVSDIRMARDLIREVYILGSDIASILHLFAHKPVTIVLPSGEEVDENSLRKNLDLGSYSLNLLYLPEGSEIHWGDTISPDAEMFRYYQEKKAELFQRFPFINAGFPFGSSGRQQDLSMTSGMKRYESVIENTQDQTSTAIEMALAITKKIPKLLPEGISRGDLDIDYRCQVLLRADDPVEADRKATLGSRLYQQGEVDLYTNLTKYQGYSQTEADDIITNLLVELVTFKSPEIAQLLGMKAAEKAGMLDELLELRKQQQQTEKGQRILGQMPPPSEMRQRTGEVESPIAREMIDDALRARGQRRSPERFTRNA